MRVCARTANRVLTGDERRDLVGCFDVRVRQQMRVRRQDRFGPVAESGRDDVKRDTVGQRERRVCVAQDVQRSRQDAGRLAVARAMTAWTIDGEPMQSRAHTEKLYAYRAVEALTPEAPVRSALETLRMLLDNAQELGLDDLAAAVSQALRLRREVASGTNVSTARVEAVVEAFAGWLEVELPALRLSW